MRWESLVSAQNLRLAWRRINTGRNLQHKRFFRDLYLVYETALDQNLKNLRQRLLAHAWIPSHPQRLYIPKPSGLQRPISLLCVEDQILLQAVANIFARNLAKKRKDVELSTVFSNVLYEPLDSIFFTLPWQVSYKDFQEKCRSHFNEGNPWIAHFDLAAYYDTISHDLLLRIISPRNKHPKTQGIVKKWFDVWSAPNHTSMTSHGIPQGPPASDFLAEAFFLPIDIELKKMGIKYVRYVDDIRLFGKSKNDVIKAGISLELLCRNRGLIPQGKKFTISYATNPIEALGSLPSIPPATEGDELQKMDASEAKNILDTCLKGKPLRVEDKSRFRYVMYRAPKSSKILHKVLSLLSHHPEHIDAFAAYFGNYEKSARIARKIFELLESGIPYNYVRGELWHLLARLGTPEQHLRALDMARKDSRNRKRCIGLSWGVMNFLIRCQEEKLCGIGKRLYSELPMSRAFLASRIPLDEFGPRRIVVKMLKGTLEEQLAISRQMQIRNITIAKLRLRPRDLPSVCQHSLKALGVIHRIRQIPKDWIAERIMDRCGGSLTPVWRSLFETDYEHALQILIEADTMFEGAISPWLQFQDSFNDTVIRHFILYLRKRKLSGGSQKIVGRDKRLVKYGNILKAPGPLASAYPSICASLLKVHERRNTLPGSHPYDEKGGIKNSWLQKRERDTLVREIGISMTSIAQVVLNNP
jgi:retron-type reverse transcriptase